VQCVFDIGLCTKSKAWVLEDACAVLMVIGVDMGSAGDCQILGGKKLDLLPINSTVLEVPHTCSQGGEYHLSAEPVA